MNAVAAFFDLDGTLIDREPLMQQAVRDITDAADLGFTEDDLAPLVGRAWQDVYVALQIQARAELSFASFIDAVMGRAQLLMDEGFPTPVLAGGVELIERFCDARVPVWLVTGSLRREADVAIRHLGIGALLSGSLAAEEYGRGKPDPECYLTAASRAGVVEGGRSRCVVVEDSEPGVRAGVAAGMRVLATSAANRPPEHPSHQDLTGAHVIVTSLAHVDDATMAALLG